MIEILNVREVNKGSFKFAINIKLNPPGIILNKLGVFEKDGKRWVNLPQEVYEENGEKKYYALIKFDEREKMDVFQRSVLSALDEKTTKKPVQEEFPF